MKWLITLEAASEADVARVLAEGIEDLSEIDGEPNQLLWTANFPEGEGEQDDDAAARAEIEAFLHRLNGVCRLRWGSAFQGIKLHSTQVVESSGGIGARVFVDAGTGYLTFDEFVLFSELLGLGPPTKPQGLEHVEGVDLERALKTAQINPAAARAVRLVDLMLRNGDEFNWPAAYAAMEIVESELRAQGVDGQGLGWWSRSEMRRFTGTANSPEVLGVAARHGKSQGLPPKPMTASDANWFIRGIVARWLSSSHAGEPQSSSKAG